MSPSDGHRNSSLIIPEFNRLIVSHASKVLSSHADRDVVDGPLEGSLDFPDQTGVVCLPVTNLTISSRSQYLHSGREVTGTGELGLGRDNELSGQGAKKNRTTILHILKT